jgi:hypothetical protein
LDARLTWAEFQYWLAFYTLEAERSLPKDKRPVRAKDSKQATAALNQIF